jgi:hypothetical protein
MGVFWKSIIPKFGIVYGILCCLLIGTLGMPGCKEEKQLADPEGTLKEHAETYWNKRLIEKDVKATYEMEFEKGSLSFPEYEQRVANAGKVTYLSVRADEVHIEGDQATVKLTLKYSIKGIPKELEGHLIDMWTIKGGEVKHVLGQKTKPFTREGAKPPG